MIALLGKRDAPTDGVEDYCIFLARALAARGVPLELVRVDWQEQGWRKAMRQLRRESANWHGKWVLLQYTALGWSRHGFPFRILAVLAAIRCVGARCAVIFHEPMGLGGPRWIDRFRGTCQNWVVQKLHQQAERSILTAPLGTISWLPRGDGKAAFVPIGANIPEHQEKRVFDSSHSPKIIAVFSVTCGRSRSQEVEDIALAARRVEQRFGHVRLEVFGRGAEDARQLLEQALNSSRIDLRIKGVIPPAEITRTLVSAHALLCVRGLITARRGTAIAGIACGLPVVGYGQPGSDPAIDAAGIRLAPWRDSEILSDELAQVLTDEKLWGAMHERSLRAHVQYFSWDAVADRYIELLTATEDWS